MEDEEWKVEETPARRGGGAGETAFSDSELESVRMMFRCREAKDDDMEGVENGLSDSEVSMCGMPGRV